MQNTEKNMENGKNVTVEKNISCYVFYIVEKKMC